MAVVASLSDAPVRAEPGGAASAQLVIRNAGSLVDSFVFRPLGGPAPWITVEPAEVSLLPEANATVTVFFRPPRSWETTAGLHPYAIRVVSRVEDEAGSATVEGQVEVGEFVDRGVELLPRTTRGRRRARLDLAVDNRGNSQAHLTPAVKQAESTLNISLDPTELIVPPGGAGFSRIRLKTNKTHWRGAPVTHPYQVLLAEAWKPPLVTDGVFVQEPVFGRAALRAAGLALLGLLALVVLWFAFLRPTFRSQARSIVQPEVAKINDRLDYNSIPAVPTTPASSKGGPTTSSSAGGPGATTTAATTATTSPGGSGGNIDFRLAAGVAPHAVPKARTFSLTDMVFQNPKGGAGTLTVARKVGAETQVLFKSELANFRDFDLHFVSPFVFPSESSVVLTIECTSTCNDVAVTFSGTER